MIGLFLILKKLWRDDQEFRTLLYILIALLGSGTMFYSLVENWSVIDSIYFCIMTISTIGYGDFAPTRDVSKIFTIFMALGGIGIFVALATKVAQGLTRRRIKRKKKRKEKNSRVKK